MAVTKARFIEPMLLLRTEKLPEGPGMAECRWLKSVTVAQFEFVKWTSDAHLSHSRFVALREDKNAKDVRREA